MTPCVLVTEKEYQKGQSIFESAEGLDVYPAPEDEVTLAEHVRKRQAAAVIVGVERYSGPLYAALSETTGDGAEALIARFGVGYDGIDLAQAHEYCIHVTNTPGVLDQSVAEHALWLMGSLARQVTVGDAAMRRNAFPSGAGMELAGKTLAVIGFGPIGQRVARIAHLGLGMRVRAAGRQSLEVLAERSGSTPAVLRETTGISSVEHDAAAVIADADVISIHLPALPALRHYFNAERLAQLKPGALLINTARGLLVDEIALHEALTAGKLGGAALDVFENEPYRPQQVGKDLRALPNVVLTPHLGSSTLEANRRMADACLANVSSFMEGHTQDLTRVSAPSGSRDAEQTSPDTMIGGTRQDRWRTTHSQMTVPA